MEIRPQSLRPSIPSRRPVAPRPSNHIPLRQRLAQMRQVIRFAVNDDSEDQEFLLDDLDFAWLASLPKTLPRGSLLNIVI